MLKNTINHIFIRKKNLKSVTQSEIITYQQKILKQKISTKNLNIVDIKSN